MPPGATSVRSLLSRYRVQAELAGVALLVAVVAVVIGKSAKANADAMTMELARLHDAANELSGFRAAFRPGTSALDSTPLPDSLAVAVSHDVRISLAQRVASIAEQSGLGSVRVQFASADTTSPPPRPELTSAPAVANYSLAVSADGRFASVLSLLRQLPPSVALQRMTLVRRTDGTGQYQIVLAVFEAAAVNQHG